MKLTIIRDELVNGLAQICEIADARSAMPVLANVLLKAEGPDVLRISATDLHLGITSGIPARIEGVGSTAVEAKKLLKIIKNLPLGDVHLSVNEDHCLEVRCGRVRYQIAGIPAEDFPEIPSFDEVTFITLDGELLKRIIEQTHFAISTDEERPHLNGAFFEGKDTTLKMVATDGYQLIEVEHTVSADLNFAMLLSLRAIKKLRKICKKINQIKIGATAHCGFFTYHNNADITMSVKLTNAHFPLYDRVIPRNNKREVITQRVQLMDALMRVSLISRDKSPSIQLIFDENKIIVSANSPDDEEASEEIDAKYQDKRLKMGFNSRYILDILQSLDCENITLLLDGPNDACIIQPVEEEGYTGMIMPCKM